MKKFAIVLSLVLIATFLATPASAIINGEEDSEHTNVGAIMMIWTQIADNPILGRLCTATLIDPQALVTAAHCYPYFENQGIGYDQIWISFDQKPLENQNNYLAVEEFIPHPDYKYGSSVNDIALVILEDPIPSDMGIEKEDLPEVGYLDTLLGNIRGKKDTQTFVIVGYGATGLWDLPDLQLDAIRRSGTVTIQNLLPLEILTARRQNDAIICYGDSGGPVFYPSQGGKEVLVGIHSHSSGPTTCADDDLGWTFKYRLDTAAAQDFISAELENLEQHFPLPR